MFICCFTLIFILWKNSTNLYVRQLARDKTENCTLSEKMSSSVAMTLCIADICSLNFTISVRRTPVIRTAPHWRTTRSLSRGTTYITLTASSDYFFGSGAFPLPSMFYFNFFAYEKFSGVRERNQEIP